METYRISGRAHCGFGGTRLGNSTDLIVNANHLTIDGPSCSIFLRASDIIGLKEERELLSSTGLLIKYKRNGSDKEVIFNGIHHPNYIVKNMIRVGFFSREQALQIIIKKKKKPELNIQQDLKKNGIKYFIGLIFFLYTIQTIFSLISKN